MADYYSILKKTISGLSNNTPEMRVIVYSKARSAIEKQLRAIEPTPSEEAIALQLLSLEDAIKRIDSEQDIPVPAAQDEQPETAPVDDVAEDDGAASQPSTDEKDIPPSKPSDEQSVQPEPETADKPAEPEPVEEAQSDVSPDVSEPASQEPDTAPIVAASSPASSVQTTEGALDAISSVVQAEEKHPSTPIAPAADETKQMPETATLDDRPLPGSDTPKKKRSYGALLGTVAVLALLGGGGYALWLNKDALLGVSEELIANVSGTGDDKVDGANAGATPEKEAVRIGEDGEDKSADPVDENSSLSGETNLPEAKIEPVTPEPEQPVEEEPETTENAQVETPVVEEPSVTVVPEPEPEQEPQAPEPEIAAEPKVALPLCSPLEPTDSQLQTTSASQTGYLYEEGSGASGPTRNDAAVYWKTEQHILEPGAEPESVVIGNMDIPEKGLSLNIALKRNTDSAVPASHYIELRFDWPDGFSGQGVEDIGRFVMKASESQPGQPLSAVPVKGNEKCFLLALQNPPKTVEQNTELLTVAGWIDIPISYSNGRRALLTLEKGITGNEAFNAAFADWKNR